MKQLTKRVQYVCSFLILISVLSACQSESAEEPSSPQNSEDETVVTISQKQDKETEETDSEPFDRNQLTIMGLAIFDPKEDMIKLLGTPIEQYAMESGTDVYIVYTYPGFYIGINADQGIQFIDVFSANVDPGLNGLKVGSSIDEAIAAIGDPDSRTPSVMTYRSANMMLKLDIDMETSKVMSIKLFES